MTIRGPAVLFVFLAVFFVALAAAAAMGGAAIVERRARRRSEQLGAATLSSLPGYVAVIDRRGVILGVNRAWRTLERSHPLAPLDAGDNWLDRCPFGEEIASRVELVLSGARRYVKTAVVVGSVPEQFLELRVRRLKRPEGGAVLSFTDVGERRRAEQEAQKARDLLVHMDRIAILAELTSTIAHELNQPLTAIHTNARVTRKLLTKTPPDIEEALAAMGDISADSERAGEVIKRLRALLRRGEARVTLQDLRAIARDAAALAGREAVARGVEIVCDLDGERLPVAADPVQIQQILLNFLSNALDALAAQPPRRRRVELSARKLGEDRAEVFVTDSGTGFDPASVERLFEPFYTTKTEGLGLGLSICRTIAEAHGGWISAELNPEGGSTFRLHLPLHRPDDPPPRDSVPPLLH